MSIIPAFFCLLFHCLKKGFNCQNNVSHYDPVNAMRFLNVINVRWTSKQRCVLTGGNEHYWNQSKCGCRIKEIVQSKISSAFLLLLWSIVWTHLNYSEKQTSNQEIPRMFQIPVLNSRNLLVKYCAETVVWTSNLSLGGCLIYCAKRHNWLGEQKYPSNKHLHYFSNFFSHA